MRVAIDHRAPGAELGQDEALVLHVCQQRLLGIQDRLGSGGLAGLQADLVGARHHQRRVERHGLDAHRAQAVKRPEIDLEGHLDRLDIAVQGDLDPAVIVALRVQHLEQARAIILGAAAQAREAGRRTIDQPLAFGDLGQQVAQRFVVDALDRDLVGQARIALGCRGLGRPGLFRKPRVVGLRAAVLSAGHGQERYQQTGAHDLPRPPRARANPRGRRAR